MYITTAIPLIDFVGLFHIHLLDVLASLKVLQGGSRRVGSRLAHLKGIQLSLINNGLDLDARFHGVEGRENLFCQHVDGRVDHILPFDLIAQTYLANELIAILLDPLVLEGLALTDLC